MAWEVIIVDDGSLDNTWEEIRDIAAAHPRFRGLRLMRNFGQQAALIAGMESARGECVITMDADLQHPPPVINDLLARWRAGVPLVLTVRIDNAQTGWFKQWTGRTFYRLFRNLTGLPLAPGMADFRLIDRSLLPDFLKIARRTGFLRGAAAFVGAPSKGRGPAILSAESTVTYQAAARTRGETKYSLRKMLGLCWAGLVGFTIAPLRAGFVVALALLLGAAVSGVLGALAQDSTVRMTMIICATILAASGVLAALLGVVGEFLGQLIQSSERRPTYIIRERVNTAPTTLPVMDERNEQNASEHAPERHWERAG